MTNVYGALSRAANAISAASEKSTELPCEDAVQLLRDVIRSAMIVLEDAIAELEAEAVR